VENASENSFFLLCAKAAGVTITDEKSIFRPQNFREALPISKFAHTKG
jgi:hypothetical protein